MAESSDTESSSEEIKENEDISDQDDSSDEQEEELDINASSTESDDDSDDIETDGDEGKEEKLAVGTKSNPRTELAIKNLLQKYNERQGKQLYIRFPEKLPADEAEFQQKVKSVSPLIVKGHKPRQKYARFCLVDFSTTADRDSAFESIRTAAKNDEQKSGIVVSLPRTEKEEYVQGLVEKKRNSIEMKRAKFRLKRESKKALRTKNFTSSIVILNLPKSASISEVRKNFSNAVDIQIKPGRGKFNGVSVATITLPSTKDARAAVKQKVSLGNTELVIRFDTKKLFQHKKKNNQKRKSKSTEDINQSPEKKKQKV